ncbi:MAG TPA: hypothetical protein VKA98_08805 [Nitrososphaeraceae archaeon]|nr:hypothetical protein [Nitrososphaeraceae archaeon]
MNNTEEKKNNQQKITTGNSNAEYVYIIENQEVWFIDYIVGIAFKTPVDFRTINRYGIGLLESGRSYTELYDIKDFQDYMEEKVGQEIDIESSIDPITNLEKDDRRIIFHTYKKVSMAPGKEVRL